MDSFPHQLRAAIQRRFDGNQAAFARALDIEPSHVTNVLRETKAPSLKTIAEWADTLGLAGDERRAFLLAAEISNAPDGVVAYVAKLNEEIARQGRVIAQLEDAVTRDLARRRARRAARQPKR